MHICYKLVITGPPLKYQMVLWLQSEWQIFFFTLHEISFYVLVALGAYWGQLLVRKHKTSSPLISPCSGCYGGTLDSCVTYFCVVHLRRDKHFFSPHFPGVNIVLCHYSGWSSPCIERGHGVLISHEQENPAVCFVLITARAQWNQ